MSSDNRDRRAFVFTTSSLLAVALGCGTRDLPQTPPIPEAAPADVRQEVMPCLQETSPTPAPACFLDDPSVSGPPAGVWRNDPYTPNPVTGRNDVDRIVVLFEDSIVFDYRPSHGITGCPATPATHSGIGRFSSRREDNRLLALLPCHGWSPVGTFQPDGTLDFWGGARLRRMTSNNLVRGAYVDFFQCREVLAVQVGNGP